MNLRLWLAIFFLCAAKVSAEELSAPIREIPIIAPMQASDGHFVLTLAPLNFQRNVIAGDAMDSTEQSFGVGFKRAPFEPITLGYYSGADVFRQDAMIFDDLAESSRVMMSWLNKMDLTLKLPGALSLDGYAQTQRGFADDQPGFSDAVKYGAALAWSPFKDVTKWKAEASTQETRGIDETLSFQDVYTASLEQKLPAVPVTLRVAESWSENRVELLPARDQDVKKIDAALLWKIRPQATWSGGVQSQDVLFTAAANAETREAIFTQLALQPAAPLGVTLRIAREEHTKRDAAKLLSEESALLLGFGGNWKFADILNAGFGVQYRVPETPRAATPAATNLPAFSVSASAKF